MCQATFGGAAPPPPAAAPSAPPPPPGAPPPAQNGSPVTHTIIVAPTQGVLRFGKSIIVLFLGNADEIVPFSVTANVGDSLEFVWGAGPASLPSSLSE